MKRANDTIPSIRVLKFGGTCLHPLKNRDQTVARIMEEVQKNHRVVAVVSAMGRQGDPYATDTLDSLLPSATPKADRERDALLCCGEGISASLIAAELNARGISAASLHGSQLGLITEGEFGSADIVMADPSRISRCLSENQVVVAAGFHGVGADGYLFTLGRGGSDTTAVAIAAALGVEQVLFYKDVEGLFTADPKIVPDARPLSWVPYDEAAHLAHAGARVLHPRSADLAHREKIAIRIKRLDGETQGTLVTSQENIRKYDPLSSRLFAVTCLDGIGQIRIRFKSGDRPSPTFTCRLFEALADAGLSLDMINVFEDGALFTVPMQDQDRASRIVEQVGCPCECRHNCAKVSLLGGGIHGVPGIMSRILTALTGKGISVYQSVDTYTVISVLVDGD
ncbi:MAG: aspartate kinase, partial [Planctomycetes bacterium]|nr:aspartate kinase [Planctomycetota bacterium]